MIFQKKRWIIKDKSLFNDIDVEINGKRIKSQIIKVLQNRGITTKEEIEKFLNPSLKSLQIGRAHV